MRKVLIFLIWMAGIVLYGQEIPYGEEFRVNDFPENDQKEPQITALSNGRFMVSWRSQGEPGVYTGGIYGQIFLRDGRKSGKEFCIIEDPDNSRWDLWIASIAGGGFVVCWTEWRNDLYTMKLYAQVYSADGDKIGQKIHVDQDAPALLEWQNSYLQIAPLSNGGFVVCWRDSYFDGFVYGQVFSSDGAKRGLPFSIDTYQYMYYDKGKMIVPLPDGGFIICWNHMFDRYSYPGDSLAAGVFCQVFTSDGEESGPPFKIDSAGQGFGSFGSQIAALPNGRFVVYWNGEMWDGTDSGYYWALYRQVFSSDMRKISDEFPAVTLEDSRQNISIQNPKLTPLSNGGFLIAWERQGFFGPCNLWGRIFSPDGESIGKEFPINYYSDGSHADLECIPFSNGGFFACWQSVNPDGVYARLFSPDGNTIGQECRIDAWRYKPLFAHLSNGDFVACWSKYDQDGSDMGLYAKRFPTSLLNHALRSFHLLEPSYDSTVKTTAPRLSWQRASDDFVCYPWELHYKIYYDVNPDFPFPAFVECDQDTTVSLHHLRPGTTYFWKVQACNSAGQTIWSSGVNAFFVERAASMENADSTSVAALGPNVPDPFQSETAIRCFLPVEGQLTLQIFNGEGELVNTLFHGYRGAGWYEMVWNGCDSIGNTLHDGGYQCRMKFEIGGDSVVTQAIAITKKTDISDDQNIPGRMNLYPNFPNPFNSETSIRFDVSEEGRVRIDLYQIDGKQARVLFEGFKRGGTYTVRWDGRDSIGYLMPSGIYICRMDVRSMDGHRFTQSVKMGLVR